MDFDKLVLYVACCNYLKKSLDNYNNVKNVSSDDLIDLTLNYGEVELLFNILLREIHHLFTPSLSGDEDIKIKPVPNEVDIPEFLNMKGENNNGNKNYL